MFGLIASAMAQGEDGEPSIPLSEEQQSQAILIGGLILAVGGALEIGSAVNNARHVLAAPNWPRVPGEIISHRIRRPLLSGMGYFVPHVLYAFTVDGQSYIHDSVVFGKHGPVKRERAEAVLRRYPIGMQVRVIHKPDNPRVCALEEAAMIGTPLAYGGTMAAIGIAFLIGWLVR